MPSWMLKYPKSKVDIGVEGMVMTQVPVSSVNGGTV